MSMEDRLTAYDEYVANEQRENLARVSHEIWAHWMRYMFTQGDAHGAGWFMPPDRLERWTRQMNTPYDELTELERMSDREQADKIIAVLDGA